MATSVTEGEERATARAEINGALRSIIDSIHVLPGEVMVWIGGGTKMALISADLTIYGYADLAGAWLWRDVRGRTLQEQVPADPLLHQRSLDLAKRFPDLRAAFSRRYPA